MFMAYSQHNGVASLDSTQCARVGFVITSSFQDEGGGKEREKAIFMGRSNLKEDNAFHKVADSEMIITSVLLKWDASTRLE